MQSALLFAHDLITGSESMYRYDAFDRQIQQERVNQYRDQTHRYLEGQLPENEYLPLRLQNGLYIQRFAPMLRVCVPYGLMSSQQMRTLANIARQYDKGYAHISTRQNVQFNWPEVSDSPEILQQLAEVEMHANQTSGNCIRNTTTDHFAGIAHDEVEDPRPWCEIIRQWSTFHPEFAALPRKFKIAVQASETDRAAMLFHDIGIRIRHNAAGETCFDVYAGGGLGRTPMIASLIFEAVASRDLLSCLESILRVYNRHGRRDNKYKARIKILVKSLGVEAFREKVNEEWQRIINGPSVLEAQEIDRVRSYFTPPEYQKVDTQALDEALSQNVDFRQWFEQNSFEHRVKGYTAITICLKTRFRAPGDITAEEMDWVADLAEKFSMGELRTTHDQNIVLADVRKDQLLELWQALVSKGLDRPWKGLLTDMICCPGGDYCALANAKSIPVAEEITRTFDALDRLHNLGPIDLNISGCMNACGHHHVGHIGILGVDKKGQEFYQIMIGGDSSESGALGKILGPSFSRDEVVPALESILDAYLKLRQDNETFIQTCKRTDIAPFKAAAYSAKEKDNA
jgi:sulfite reductase (NADPH) hemoprotein beta-component